MSENERSSTFRQPLLALMASLAAFMAIFSCVVPEPSSTSVLAAKTDRVQDRLWYFARSPFAREPLSVIRGPDGRIARVCYLIPRHKGANWVGPGRGRKSTRPGGRPSLHMRSGTSASGLTPRRADMQSAGMSPAAAVARVKGPTRTARSPKKWPICRTPRSPP